MVDISDFASSFINDAWIEIRDQQEQFLIEFFGSYVNAQEFGKYFVLTTEENPETIISHGTFENTYTISYITKLKLLPIEVLEEEGLWPLSEKFLKWADERQQKR